MKYEENKAVVDEPSVWTIKDGTVTVKRAGGIDSYSYEDNLTILFGDIHAWAPADNIEPIEVTPVEPTPSGGGESGGGSEGGGDNPGGDTPGGGDNPDTPINPDPTPSGDSSYAEYTGGNGIRFILHNNCGIEARFSGAVVLNLSRNPDDWDNSTQAYAHIIDDSKGIPDQNGEYHKNNIVIQHGGTYPSPEITTITGIYMPNVNFTDGTWYLMNSMIQPAGHPVYLYTREFSKSRQEVSGSQHMYAATPTVNTKLQKGYTYHLNINWVNPDAMLADINTTVNSFNASGYNYAILYQNKTSL